LADSSVSFATRAWCNTDDYWDIYFDLHKSVYDRFEAEEGLSIPFPQVQIHSNNQ